MKKILCLFFILSIINSVLWGFAYDGSGQVSTYPGGDNSGGNTSGGNYGSGSSDGKKLVEEFERELGELTQDMAELESAIPDNASVENNISEDNFNSDTQDLSIEENIIPEINENNAVVANEEKEASAETTGDPVIAATGEYIQTDVDYVLKKGFRFERTYRLNNNITGVFGNGWSSTFDERILLGKHPDFHELISKQGSRTSQILSKANTVQNSIINFYHVSSLSAAETELTQKFNKASELKEEAEKFLVQAQSTFGKGSEYARRAEDRYEQILEIFRRYETALNSISSYISMYNNYYAQYSDENQYYKELKALQKKSLEIENSYSWYKGTPESWIHCGLENLLFIDSLSVPHTFEPAGSEWISKSKSNRTFEKITKSDDGQFQLFYCDGTIKHFNIDGLITKIENAQGDFLKINRNDTNLITSVETSLNEKFIFSFSTNSKTPAKSCFVTSIENARDSSDKIIYAYKNDQLDSVTDSDGDTVFMIYDTTRKLSSIKKCDGSFIRFKASRNPQNFRYYISETQNEEGFSEFFSYDLENNKTEYTDHDGNKSVLYFDDNQNTIRKTDSSGNDFNYEYDGKGNLLSQKINGLETLYEYDAKNRLVKTFFHDGTSEEYFYDKFSNPIKYNDRDGFFIELSDNTRDITYKYDEYGNISQAEADGHIIDINYDERNRITSLFLDGKAKFSITYKTKEQIINYTTGLSVSKTFNGRKDLIKVTETDSNENTEISFLYEYDKRHLEKKKSVEINGKIQTLWEKEWTPEGRLSVLKEYDDSDCWITEYKYENGKIVSEIKWKESKPEEKFSVEIEENIGSGNLITRKFKNEYGHESTLKFSEDGYLKQFINEEGEVYDYNFSPAGRLLSNTSTYGKKINYEYDTSGKIIENNSGKDPYASDYYEYGYDSYGRIISMTNPEGNTKKCHYNFLGQIDKVYDGYGNCTELKYNAKNLIKEKIFPDGTTFYYEYNANQNLTKISDNLGLVWLGDYDKAGNLVHEEGRAQNSKKYSYDKTGRVTSVFCDDIILESYEYSNYGRNVVFKDGNQNPYYIEKNEDGELISETNRLDETKNYSDKTEDENNIEIIWDGDGKILKASNETSSFEYTYNANGQLESFSDIPAIETVHYEYDKSGRRIRTKSINRDISYFYGANNELLEIRDNLSKLNVKFFYDVMMREIKREYGNKVTLEFSYDMAGRMSAVIEKDFSGKIINGEIYFYGEDGRRCATADYKGSVTFYSYNKLGQLSSVIYSATSSFTEHLKKEASRSGIDPEKISFSTREFSLPYETYNEYLEFVEENFPGFSFSRSYNVYEESFSYDKNGNRKTRTYPWGKIEYFYDAENKLTEICYLGKPVVKYDYDANGNLVNRVSESCSEKYTYTAGNRLADYVKTCNGKVSTCHYTYDVFGRRQLTVRDNKAALRCLYDGFSFDLIKESPVFQNGLFTDNLKNNFFMAEERESDERYIFTFDSGEDYSPVEESFPLSYNGIVYGRQAGSHTEYFGTEILGTVKSVTDHFGNLEKSFDYDVFGSSISTSVPVYGYTGKTFDPITQLYNFGFRDYSSDTSRFTSLDPVRDGSNWYQYCAADPVNYVDLWGLDMLRLTYVKGSNKLQIVNFPVNEYGNVIPDKVQNVGTFEVSNNVRNEINGLRSEPNAKTTPVLGTPENYYPRDFPAGTWEVGTPRESTNAEVNGLFIPTNAVQEVPVYGSDLANAPKDENGNFISTGTQLDTAYGLHATKNSKYTQGCIKLKDTKDSDAIVKLINDTLSTKDGAVTLLVMDFEYPNEQK